MFPMNRPIVTGLIAITVLTAGAARAQVVVVPNANGSTEGNSNDFYPFDLGLVNGAVPSIRCQQLLSASQFPSAEGMLTITGIAFRADGPLGTAFGPQSMTAQIDLSTSPMTPATLSTTFASNVGPDDTVVFKGQLTLSSRDTGPAGGPKAFDMTIPMQSPFVYDPVSGNLLLDVRVSSVATTSVFDSVNISPVMETVEALNVDAPTASFPALDLGLVTQFEFTPVPEPGTLALTGIAAIGWVTFWRRRWQSNG
jgi:hypothetical protein